MNTYYRFYFVDTLEALEFDTEHMSLEEADRRANEWAKDSNTTYEFCGVVERDY